MGQLCMPGDRVSKGMGAERQGSSQDTGQAPPTPSDFWPCPHGYRTCEAHGALESTTHALEAVFNEVAEELGWGVEHLVAQFTLMVNAFLCKRKRQLQ